MAGKTPPGGVHPKGFKFWSAHRDGRCVKIGTARMRISAFNVANKAPYKNEPKISAVHYNGVD